MKQEVATLAGGCFWCLEAVYDELKGVQSVESGYANGAVPNPTYEQVCSGKTGHAEVVQITFDSEVVSFRNLLEVFFTVHDPTTLNRQGADVGTQYRSAIFYHSPEQKATAEAVISELTAEKLWNDPIVTEVAPLDLFYVAEEYHQEYFANHPYQGYCQVVIAPKVAKFRKQYLEQLKVKSVFLHIPMRVSRDTLIVYNRSTRHKLGWRGDYVRQTYHGKTAHQAGAARGAAECAARLR
jgi:peptide-methionine (S)-S-oxide reductase